ncbi:MAG: hypothetical protein IJ640_06285 [Prevotella sp.]|nr:hypothetical protein [Prevotella sp.]
MGKFKLEVLIGRNATEMLNLPCVLGVWKEFLSDTDFRLRYSIFVDSKTVSAMWGECINAYEGYWLCEDYNGEWHVLSDKEYQEQR